jgi:hypothetical protein
MDTLTCWGALAFGLVIGWVTYRTLRRTKQTGLSDIASVIGAVGGASVTKLFPQASGAFGAYGIGLAVGFFVYLIVSMIVARKIQNFSAINEWLGEPPHANPGGGGGPLQPDHH